MAHSYISIGLNDLKVNIKRKDILAMAFEAGVQSAINNESEIPINSPSCMKIVNRFKDNYNPLTREIIGAWRKGYYKNA